MNYSFTCRSAICTLFSYRTIVGIHSHGWSQSEPPYGITLPTPLYISTMYVSCQTWCEPIWVFYLGLELTVSPSPSATFTYILLIFFQKSTHIRIKYAQQYRIRHSRPCRYGTSNTCMHITCDEPPKTHICLVFPTHNNGSKKISWHGRIIYSR